MPLLVTTIFDSHNAKNSKLLRLLLYQEVEEATDCDVNSTQHQHQQQAIADRSEQCKLFTRNVSTAIYMYLIYMQFIFKFGISDISPIPYTVILIATFTSWNPFRFSIS